MSDCNQTCINEVGSYSCSCGSGYRLSSDGRGCNDINECALGTDSCGHNCSNTFGSYMCSCESDYRLANDGRLCNDIDECAGGTDGCAQTCTNTPGSYVCSCQSGYRLARDRHGCFDIDECVEDLNNCSQSCINSLGSYNCSCNPGYRLASDERMCNDTDECAEDSDGCAHVCVNEVGGYSCSCRSGYQLASDERGCAKEDVDECAEDTSNCSQICTNTIESYSCSCISGYRIGRDGHECEDINECTEGQHNCFQRANAVCSNTIGSYTCNCQTGYQLEGRVCRVSEQLPFQIKFGLSDDSDSESKCSTFVVNNPTTKINEIANFIAQQIIQLCQCQYSGNYIIDGQLFCASKNGVIYQAQLLSITGKTAQEIHNVTEQWVLSQPSIMIDGVSYQVDPSCSTEVKELGVTSCTSPSESDEFEGSAINIVVLISVVIGVVVLLMILSGLIVASLYYLHKRNSKSKNLPSVQYQPHKSKCADSPDGDGNTSKEVTAIDSVYEPMDLHDHLSSSISEYTKEDCSEKPACPTDESSSDGVSGNMYSAIQ